MVIFRGTTPSPLRGLLREGQINSMAGQEEWSEAPPALSGSRVHRGYAGAYRTVLADVEGAVTAWARTEAEKTSGGAGGDEEGVEGVGGVGSTKPPPKVVVVGHSLGGVCGYFDAKGTEGTNCSPLRTWLGGSSSKCFGS